MSAFLRKAYPFIFLFIIIAIIAIWNGESLHPLVAFLSAIPWFLWSFLFIIIALIYGFVLKENVFFIIIIAVVFSLPFLIRDTTADNTVSFAPYKVCSLNTRYFFEYLLDKPSSEQSVQLALTKLKSDQCKVYLLQEIWLGNKRKDEITNFFKGAFPEYEFRMEGEFIILSLFPIRQTQLDSPEGYFRADIEMPLNKTVSFYNVHEWNPLFARRCESFQGTQYKNDCPISAFNLRNDQRENLLASLKVNPNPVLIAGDFNSMEQSKVIRDLSDKLTPVLGSSFGSEATFPSIFPLIAIDHIFVSPSIEHTEKTIVCRNDLSDHCMVQTFIN